MRISYLSLANSTGKSVSFYQEELIKTTAAKI